MSRRPLRPLILAPLVLVMAASFQPACAVQTEIYRYARMEDYQDSSFRELILADDGSWRLGPRWEEVLADDRFRVQLHVGMPGRQPSSPNGRDRPHDLFRLCLDHALILSPAHC